MMDAEICVPVRCPICAQEALAQFRLSVVVEALRTGEMRLYAACHVASWEASEQEIFWLHEYLEAGDDRPPVFVHTEMMEQLRPQDLTFDGPPVPTPGDPSPDRRRGRALRSP